MSSVLRLIDMFGKGYNLNFNNSNCYKNKFGGLLTILCIFTLFFSLIFFGLQFIIRDNPFLIMRTFPSGRSNLTFNMHISFNVEDEFGNYVPNALDYMSIDILYYKVDYLKLSNGLYYSDVKEQSLKTHICKQEDFSEENRIAFNNNNMYVSTCLDSNNSKIGGYFDQDQALVPV